MPSWEYMGNEIWCGLGRETLSLDDAGMKETMERILQESSEVTKALESNGFV